MTMKKKQRVRGMCLLCRRLVRGDVFVVSQENVWVLRGDKSFPELLDRRTFVLHKRCAERRRKRELSEGAGGG